MRFVSRKFFRIKLKVKLICVGALLGASTGFIVNQTAKAPS